MSEYRIHLVVAAVSLCALLFPLRLSASLTSAVTSDALSSAVTSDALTATEAGEGSAPASTVRNDFSIYYLRDGIDVDPEYLDNKANLEKIRTYLAHSPKIDSIVIYAYASPEGVYERNVWLSRKRAEAAKRFILENLPENSALKAENILLRPMNENWGGVLNEIESSYHRHDREKVLAILRDDSVGNDTKKWRLKQLDDGYTYKYIIKKHMPRLRLATWVCVWEELPVLVPLPRIAKDTVLLAAPAGDIVPYERQETPQESVPAAAKDKRTFMALKTNLLYDAVTAVNYSIEFPINEHFSILYNQVTPWWLSKNNKYCLQVLTFGGEFRWWFKPETRPASSKLVKRDALMGHFLGVYGFGGKFDVQWEDKLGLYQGEVMSFGLTYGYSMPIGKRVNLEFSISAGYASIPYRHYIPTDDWQILIRDRNNAGRMHWFGPTKAEISLVIPLLANRKVKGGGR